MKKLIIAAALAVATTTSVSAHTSDATQYVIASAKAYGVPQEFALKVAKHESGIQCGRVGASGERGPLQVMPATAKGLGFKNIRQASCKTQTDAGMKHLAKCYHGMAGNRWMAAACHNMGFRALTTAAARLPKRVKAYANAVVGKSAPVIKTALAAPVKAANAVQSTVTAPFKLFPLLMASEAPLKPARRDNAVQIAPVADRPNRMTCNWVGCPKVS